MVEAHPEKVPDEGSPRMCARALWQSILRRHIRFHRTACALTPYTSADSFIRPMIETGLMARP